VRDKTRAYVGSRFFLDLNQAASGWLLTSEGGQAFTESVNERLAGGHPVRKHPGNVKVDDITISCGAQMSKQFYDWLSASLQYNYERKDGAIITCDYDYNEITRLNFYEALIAEIGFPALDAGGKEPGKFNLKIATEYTEQNFAGGGSVLPVPIDPSKQKRWMASNFRLQIDGMDCKRVNKIDAITIKQNIVENAIGERLIFQKEPAQIDFPSLIISIPENEIEPWYKWHKSFVMDGNSDPSTEKSGSLSYLSSDLQSELFSLSFTNLGIIKFTPDRHDSSTEKLRYVRVEMYCESMKFSYKQ
jgi:hypothetical protein